MLALFVPEAFEDVEVLEVLELLDVLDVVAVLLVIVEVVCVEEVVGRDMGVIVVLIGNVGIATVGKGGIVIVGTCACAGFRKIKLREKVKR